MERKPKPDRYGTDAEKSAWWNSREGKKESDRIEAEYQKSLPKPRPGGLAGWVLEKVRGSSWIHAESAKDDRTLDKAEQDERHERNLLSSRRQRNTDARLYRDTADTDEKQDRKNLNSSEARRKHRSDWKTHRKQGDYDDKHLPPMELK